MWEGLTRGLFFPFWITPPPPFLSGVFHPDDTRRAYTKQPAGGDLKPAHYLKDLKWTVETVFPFQTKL